MLEEVQRASLMLCSSCQYADYKKACCRVPHICVRAWRQMSLAAAALPECDIGLARSAVRCNVVPRS
jgi:hypothetical protein